MAGQRGVSGALAPAPAVWDRSKVCDSKDRRVTDHMMVATPDGPGPFPTVMLRPRWPGVGRARGLFDPWTSTLVERRVAVAKVKHQRVDGLRCCLAVRKNDGNIGFPEVEDVVAGMGYLIDLGISDPQRCAIEGWSWGSSRGNLAMGTHPDAFVAAIGGCPVCDSVMTHEDCSIAAGVRACHGRKPGDVPERYAERSPSTYLDAVRTPLLLTRW